MESYRNESVLDQVRSSNPLVLVSASGTPYNTLQQLLRNGDQPGRKSNLDERPSQDLKWTLIVDETPWKCLTILEN